MLGRTVSGMMLVFVFFCFGASNALSLESIPLSPDIKSLDITQFIKHLDHTGEQVSVSIAPGSDGVVRRIVVRANGDAALLKRHWAVFALSNTSDKQINRLLVADHYRLFNSGVIWPDLGMSRIVSITPSQGIAPTHWAGYDSDVFMISLAPYDVVTFVLELRTPGLPQLYLWEQGLYENKLNNLSFFYGGIIGISGILALLLTTLFVVRWSPIFLAAASFAWSVFAYLCIDFGLWERIFVLPIGPLYRIIAEIMLSATLLIFLFTFLRLYRLHMYIVSCILFWLFCLLLLSVFSQYDPLFAAGMAHFSLAALGVIGFALIVFFALKRCDRAIMLIPVWVLFLVWLLGIGTVVLGYWDGALITSSLTMVVLIMAFIVMQHAFSDGGGIITQETDAGRKALALSGSGDAIWDWSIDRKWVFTGPEIEKKLGYEIGTLSCSIKKWLSHIYFADQTHFASILQAAVYQCGGRIDENVRMLCADGHYVWLCLKARPVIGQNNKIVRCIGTLSDVTIQHTAKERLLHDAIYDSLTGLPSMALLLDRLDVAIQFAQSGYAIYPILFVIDLDWCSKTNQVEGSAVDDSILLAISRRLSRDLGPHDVLGRLFGNRFGLILFAEHDPRNIVDFSETIRTHIEAPIMLSNREIVLTANIGISICNVHHRSGKALLSEAGHAMYRARQLESDRIEIFQPNISLSNTGHAALQIDLRRATERGGIELLYQPIMNLTDLTTVGFEVFIIWDHPQLGRLNSGDILELIDDKDQISELGLFVMNSAAVQLRDWHGLLNCHSEIFTSINFSDSRFLRHGFVNDLKNILSHTGISPRDLKIEISESMVASNMEYMVQVLKRLREMNVGSILNNFGTGHFVLDCLATCQFDIIKISETFIRVDGTGNRSTLLRPVMMMLRQLGVKILAKGVECSEDVHDLRKMGCLFAQGNFFGAPLTAKQVRTKLTDIRSK